MKEEFEIILHGRIRRVFGRSFAKIDPDCARILGQPCVGGWSALGLVGSGLGFAGHGAWRQENEGGGEGQGRKGTVEVHRASATICPLFLFFWIQFYHKTSTYCINNRIPELLIINRIYKYNRWSAYWRFDYIKDRFSKL